MKGIRKRGKTWTYYLYAGNGKTISKGGFPTREDAESAKAKAEEELKATGSVLRDSKKLFIDVVNEWFEGYRHEIRTSTQVDYLNAIRHLSEEYFATWTIGRITPKVLQEYVNKKAQELVSLKAHYAVLNKSLEYAVYPMQYIRESPMHYVRRYRKKKSVLEQISYEDDKVPTVSLEDYAKIKSAMPKQYQIVFDIALNTGCRLGEVCALTWDDVDFDSRTISITKSLNYNPLLKIWEIAPTKTGIRRRLAMTDTLIRVLRSQDIYQKSNRLAHGNTYLEPRIAVLRHDTEESLQLCYEGKGKPYRAICTQPGGSVINSQSVKSQIKRLRDKKIIGDFHFHMLRHTHATLLLTSGAPMKEVQERLGHSKIATTMDIYAHTTEQSRRSTADLFEKIISGA